MDLAGKRAPWGGRIEERRRSDHLSRKGPPRIARPRGPDALRRRLGAPPALDALHGQIGDRQVLKHLRKAGVRGRRARNQRSARPDGSSLARLGVAPRGRLHGAGGAGAGLPVERLDHGRRRRAQLAARPLLEARPGGRVGRRSDRPAVVVPRADRRGRARRRRLRSRATFPAPCRRCDQIAGIAAVRPGGKGTRRHRRCASRGALRRGGGPPAGGSAPPHPAAGAAPSRGTAS